MHDGRIQQVGTAISIYRQPRNQFVADFIGRANFLPATVNAKNDDSWSVTVQGINLNIPASASPDLKAGDEALVLARPESIRLHVEPAPSGRSIQGTVQHTFYLGSLAEYNVEMGGQSVAVVLHDPKAGDLFAPGTTVHVDFLDTNLYLLPWDHA